MLLAEAFFAGCWWLGFRWLLVAGAYAPLATGGFTSAGNALVCGFFTGLSSQ